VKRVYGDPSEKDGTTIIPAAAVRGGLGGGSQGTGEQGRVGGGFGMDARPVGAYVLKDGVLRWRPAIDVEHIMKLGLMSFALVGLMTVRLFGRKRFSRVIALRRRAPRRSLRAFLAR
jgi:uncharacterized spore protein YtfJ